jgi:hypothetical protein
MHRTLLIAAALLGSTGSLFAQDSEPRFEVGAAAGGVIYQGDLVPSPAGSYRTMRGMFSGWIGRSFSNKFSVRGTFMLGSVKGNDALYENPVWRKERALRFDASIAEASALAVWNISGRQSVIAPYVFVGIGYAFTDIRRDASRFNHAYFINDKAAEGLVVDMARTPPKGFAVVPLGIGLRYNISEHLSVITETNYRLSHTDYLDGFSQAGNPKLYDHYQSYLLGLSYRFDGFSIGGVGNRSSNRKSLRSQGCPRF